MKLKNKRVLITAGPTWVKIDKVRVISNTASGKTGLLFADAFKRLGSKVTLLLGPINLPLQKRSITVKKYKFFDELNNLIKKELKNKKYDIAIHSAAVSDYAPCMPYPKKIKSNLKSLTIKFKPTFKIIRLFKKIQPKIFLIGFKYEPEAKKDNLYKEAVKLIRQSCADLVISNTVKDGKYSAFLMEENKISKVFKDRESLVKGAIKIIGGYYA
ncbi:MAG: phosphopantothenoylcysteine decarboxylase [Candidatus Omnitrophota bacterium]